MRMASRSRPAIGPIRGLVINRFTGASGSARSAIALSGGGGNVIEGNFLGTDAPARLDPLLRTMQSVSSPAQTTI